MSSFDATIIPSFIIVLIIVMIPAVIAYQKGRGSALWWFYGLILWPIALIHAACLSPTEDVKEKRLLAQGMVKCQFCAEIIKRDAKICKHCKNVT